jgi:hypothetical protein
MKHIKLFEEFISEQDVICEATVMMDALDPNSRDLKKLLKKHNVEMEIGAGTDAGTEVTLTGKRSDLEKVLADPMGWDDPDLAEYIEESKSLRESTNSGITVDGKPVKFSSIELGNVHKWDRPDFADAYASYAEFEDGKKLTDAQLDKLTDDHADVINDIANNQ